MAHVVGYCFDASASGEAILPAREATRQAGSQPDDGPVLETPDFGGGGVSLFVPTWEASDGDQLIGRLTRFKAHMD